MNVRKRNSSSRSPPPRRTESPNAPSASTTRKITWCSAINLPIASIWLPPVAPARRRGFLSPGKHGARQHPNARDHGRWGEIRTGSTGPPVAVHRNAGGARSAGLAPGGAPSSALVEPRPHAPQHPRLHRAGVDLREAARLRGREELVVGQRLERRV